WAAGRGEPREAGPQGEVEEGDVAVGERPPWREQRGEEGGQPAHGQEGQGAPRGTGHRTAIISNPPARKTQRGRELPPPATPSPTSGGLTLETCGQAGPPRTGGPHGVIFCGQRTKKPSAQMTSRS